MENDKQIKERENCLIAARDCVCKDREDDYGSPEDNFKTIAHLWSDFLQDSGRVEKTFVLRPEDVAIMMALMKIARLTSGRFKGDSYIDACGYLACGYEMEMNKFKTTCDTFKVTCDVKKGQENE